MPLTCFAGNSPGKTPPDEIGSSSDDDGAGSSSDDDEPNQKDENATERVQDGLVEEEDGDVDRGNYPQVADSREDGETSPRVSNATLGRETGLTGVLSLPGTWFVNCAASSTSGRENRGWSIVLRLTTLATSRRSSTPF